MDSTLRKDFRYEDLNVEKMLMKLETRTFDLYAKVLSIAFATVIRLCAPFRCQPCFQMSNSLIGLLLEVYIPSCSVKPQLV